MSTPLLLASALIAVSAMAFNYIHSFFRTITSYIAKFMLENLFDTLSHFSGQLVSAVYRAYDPSQNSSNKEENAKAKCKLRGYFKPRRRQIDCR